MAANLTDISVKARKGIRYGIYSIIVLIFLRFAWIGGKAVYLAIVPPAPPPPTVLYGPLPEIRFPELTRSFPEMTYTLETASGSLPEFSDRATVYVMPQAAASVFSLDEAIAKATGLGYKDSEPIELTETLYRFNHREVPASMRINIVTGIFTTDYTLAFDPTPLDTVVPSFEEANTRAESILQSSNSFPEDLTEGERTHEFLQVEGQNLVSALSESDADLIRVNLYRQPYDELPAVTTNPAEANVWLILSGGNKKQELIAAQYHYFAVDAEQSSTYPIKTAQQAYDQLIEGGGYIADLGLNTQGNVTVRQVYLAYFDPSVSSQYYQPVVVFEGDNGFFAYVPAVTSEFYNVPASEASDTSAASESGSVNSSQE